MLEGGMELMRMRPHLFDVALCSIALKSATRSLSLVATPGLQSRSRLALVST